MVSGHRYSVESCLDQFRIRFPDYHCDDHCLRRKIRRTLERIQETGSVVKSKSSGRPPVAQDIVEDIRALICSSAPVCFSDHSYVHLVILSSSRVL
jgi:hypothetical protein